MRIRAGAVLIENDKVALIERYRDGKHYFVFPGGGADEGETPEQAAIREMEEETGLRVSVKHKLAEIYFGLSTQHYFLVECLGGEFGSGTGEEYTDANPNHPAQGIYIPIWMPIAELPEHEDVYPAEVVELVLQAVDGDWPKDPIIYMVHPR